MLSTRKKKSCTPINNSKGLETPTSGGSTGLITNGHGAGNTPSSSATSNSTTNNSNKSIVKPNQRSSTSTTPGPATAQQDSQPEPKYKPNNTFSRVQLPSLQQRQSAPSGKSKEACLKEMMPALDDLLSTSITQQNILQQQRQLRKLLSCLEDWDQINDETLLKLVNQIKNKDLEALDEKMSPLIHQILNGNWPTRSHKVVKAMEDFLSEVLVAKSSFGGVAIQALVSKFNPVLSASSIALRQADEIPVIEEKIYRIAHRNLKRVFEAFPMKSETGVKTMSGMYPYMTKSPHIHYCFVKNLLQAISYIPQCQIPILHLIIHKLTRIDVNIPREDLEETLYQYNENNFDVKNELGGQDTFNSMEIDGAETSFVENPLIQIMDVCLNLVFEHLTSETFALKTSKEIDEQEDNSESTQSLLFDSLLTIFETEILPTFGVCNVQYLFFYLINLRPKFATKMLEFLWKKVISMNTSTIIRIQSLAYISGILARATVISVKTIKRWLTRLSDWANEYVDNKVSSCHWSSVNIESHGIFYAVCQAIFYVIAFHNKELIGSRKCIAFTRTLNLGRLVTSELNPLKVCSDEVAISFVNAARQHQISYCHTVLERNQTATIPLIARESMSNLTHDSSAFTVTQLESFFPFDPFCLRRSKTWVDSLYRIYEPYLEELKVEKVEGNNHQTTDDNEDSIEMELGTSVNEKSSFRTTNFYCNGSSPFKFKSDIKEDLDEFIDL